MRNVALSDPIYAMADEMAKEHALTVDEAVTNLVRFMGNVDARLLQAVLIGEIRLGTLNAIERAMDDPSAQDGPTYFAPPARDGD